MYGLEYYAVDWLAMLLTLVAIWHIGNMSPSGFVLMVVANLCWVGVGVMGNSLALVIANLVFVLMNLRALKKWSKSRSGHSWSGNR